MNTKESKSKKVIPFCCEKCAYTTSRKSQYDRHIVTSKHLKLISEVENTYECSCGKSYSHMSTLCAHKKKCTILNQEETGVEKEGVILKMTDIQGAIPNMDMSLIFAFMKDTQEFKQIMLEQSNTIMEQRNMIEQNKQMILDQNKLMVDLVKKLTKPHYTK